MSRDDDLVGSLIDCSTQLQRLNDVALAAGLDDLAQVLRKTQWKINAALHEILHHTESEAS